MLLYSIMSFGDRSGNSYMKDELLLKDYKRLSQTLPAMKGLAIIMIVMYHLWGYTNGYLSISEIATLVTQKGASSLG